MPTTHALEDERALDTAWGSGDLPALSAVDRVALRLGTTLILWGHRHAERQDRAEQARTSLAAEHASAGARDAFERRAWSGPIW